MADFEQGCNFTQVTAAATTLISNRSCNVKSMSVLGTGNGTVLLYNVASTGGTTAALQLVALNLTAPTVPTTLPVNANFTNGLVSATTGTVSVGISWV